MLDSFMMVELIVFLEAAAGRRMKPTDIQLDNLDTIQRILGFFGDGP